MNLPAPHIFVRICVHSDIVGYDGILTNSSIRQGAEKQILLNAKLPEERTLEHKPGSDAAFEFTMMEVPPDAAISFKIGTYNVSRGDHKIPKDLYRKSFVMNYKYEPKCMGNFEFDKAETEFRKRRFAGPKCMRLGHHPCPSKWTREQRPSLRFPPLRSLSTATITGTNPPANSVRHTQ